MRQYFTYYWVNSIWEERAANPEPRLLRHTAGNQFLRRGVKLGDYIYIVTVIKGELFLLARMEVGEICDQRAAAIYLDCSPDDLWGANEHLVAKPGSATLMNFDCEIPLNITEKLEFISTMGNTHLKFKAPGYLDTQTLRGLRQLTPASAQQLDKFLTFPPNFPANSTIEDMAHA
jgi:hypothetical protein